jgi:hypothetical protein
MFYYNFNKILSISSSPWNNEYGWNRDSTLNINSDSYVLIKVETGGLAYAQKSPIYILHYENNEIKDVTDRLIEGFTFSEVTREILVGDFNNDGNDDFFLSNQGREDPAGFPGEKNQLFIYSNLENLYKETLFTDQDFSHGSALGDFNGDGYLDIFVNNLGQADNVNNYFSFNNGNNEFTTTYLPDDIKELVGPLSTALDINNDGKYEIVSSSNDYEISIWTISNDSTLNAIDTKSINIKESGIFALSNGYFDDNDHKDILITGDTGTLFDPTNPTTTLGGDIRLFLYLNPGTSSAEIRELFTENEATIEVTGGIKVVLADINNDGVDEIELQTYRSDWERIRLTSFFDPTNKSFSIVENIGGINSQGTYFDANNDGTLDYLTESGGQLVILQGEFSESISQNGSGGVFLVSGYDPVNGTDNNDFFYATNGYAQLDGLGGNDTYQLNESYGSDIFLEWNENIWSFLYQKKIFPPLNVALSNFEYLNYKNRSIDIISTTHDSYSAVPSALWHFFIVAFNGAPGVTYMNQLKEAFDAGYSVKDIVNVFTTKSQFTDIYPDSLSKTQFAEKLTNNVVKDSASTEAKQKAVSDIVGALDSGLSRGDVIYNVFGNLSSVPTTNAVWGNTSKQFENQIAVAQFYTDDMSQSTTYIPQLRAILGAVDQNSDVSSDDAIIEIIGTALLSDFN